MKAVIVAVVFALGWSGLSAQEGQAEMVQNFIPLPYMTTYPVSGSDADGPTEFQVTRYKFHLKNISDRALTVWLYYGNSCRAEKMEYRTGFRVEPDDYEYKFRISSPGASWARFDYERYEGEGRLLQITLLKERRDLVPNYADWALDHYDPIFLHHEVLEECPESAVKRRTPSTRSIQRR